MPKYVEKSRLKSKCFVLGHLKQATTEDIFYGRKTLESNPKKTKHLLPFEAQHKVFSRLLTVSKTRPVDLRSAFLYELSGVPLSIFHSTG